MSAGAECPLGVLWSHGGRQLHEAAGDPPRCSHGSCLVSGEFEELQSLPLGLSSQQENSLTVSTSPSLRVRVTPAYTSLRYWTQLPINRWEKLENLMVSLDRAGSCVFSLQQLEETLPSLS